MPQKGWVWGQIYIVVSIVMAVIGIIWGVMFFSGMPVGAIPEITVGSVVVLLILSALWLLGAIGLWGRWKWGLFLTYGLLVLSGAWAVVNFILALLGPLTGASGGAITGQLILMIIHLLVVGLYFFYFYRRRSWFR